MLSRREVLRRASLVLGYAVTGSTASAVLSGCRIEPSLDWTPRALTPQQIVTVRAMADHLLPTTSTPGAADLQVERFIDQVLRDFTPEADRQTFLTGLTAFETRCQTQFGRSFTALSPAERDEIFAAYEAESPPLPPTIWGGQISADVQPPTFYRMFKAMAVTGYFNSEVVGEQLLAYDPIPGSFDGCIPLSDVGKAWSLG
jgi:hypothetical protein